MTSSSTICIENSKIPSSHLLFIFLTGELFVFVDVEVKENTDSEKSDGKDLACLKNFVHCDYAKTLAAPLIN